MGVGSDSTWVWIVEESPKNPPELELNDYKNSYLTENEIPSCEDAVSGQLCY